MVITVKDLLAIVARRVDSAVKRSGDPSQDLDSRPAWLPVTYNLMTELPQFVSYFQHREARYVVSVFLDLDLRPSWLPVTYDRTTTVCVLLPTQRGQVCSQCVPRLGLKAFLASCHLQPNYHSLCPTSNTERPGM